MGGAFKAGYRSLADNTPEPTGDQRLVRLAAAISKHAGVSGRGELHNLDIPPAAAAQVALRGLSQSEALSPPRCEAASAHGSLISTGYRSAPSWTP